MAAATMDRPHEAIYRDLTRIYHLSPQALHAEYLALPTQRSALALCDNGNVLCAIRYDHTIQDFKKMGIPVTLGSGKQARLMEEIEVGRVTLPDGTQTGALTIEGFQREYEQQKRAFCDALRRERADALAEDKSISEPSTSEIINAFNALFYDAPAGADYFTGFMHERLVYLEDLKARMAAADVAFTMVGLTNSNAIHGQYMASMIQNQGVAKYIGFGRHEDGQFIAPGSIFKAFFTSYELGARKGVPEDRNPEHLIMTLCVALGYIPNRITLWDDSQSYCHSIEVGCKRLGIEAQAVLLQTFSLREFIEKVERSLPPGAPQKEEDEIEAYLTAIQTETQKRFGHLSRRVTAFSGTVVESAQLPVHRLPDTADLGVYAASSPCDPAVLARLSGGKATRSASESALTRGDIERIKAERRARKSASAGDFATEASFSVVRTLSHAPDSGDSSSTSCEAAL